MAAAGGWRGVAGAAVRPLRARSTYRRFVFLMLGAALALAFTMIDATVLVTVPLQRLALPVAALVLLVVIGLPPAAVSLIPAIRSVEGSAVRSLVNPALPANLPPSRDWDTTWRAALWFLLHLVAGAIAGAGVVALATLGVGLLTAPFLRPEELAAAPLRLPTGGVTAVLPLVAVLLVVGYGYLVSLLGAGLARFAPPLLGPSPAERLTALQERTDRLAERNRLARELHDSVGHALTVTTLQAGAASRVLADDPEFARRALEAIEEAGRSALADLDHVLGLLREEGPRPDGGTAPVRTLAGLDALLASTRAAGVEVRAELPSDLSGVPAVVSREAYRIVQEGLTNALRHAGPVPVRLRVAVHDDNLELELDNPMPTSFVPRRRGRLTGGRGLSGLRERVALLHGDLSAEAAGGHWRLRVTLPLRAGGAR